MREAVFVSYARTGLAKAGRGGFNMTPAMTMAAHAIKSAVDKEGLPSEKLCPRDAIERKPIGYIDPDDPANNFYEYIIDEELCNGCGRCVMGCKEPAGLGSIRLEVRHSVCLDCNRCSIATVCPEDAYLREETVV